MKEYVMRNTIRPTSQPRPSGAEWLMTDTAFDMRAIPHWETLFTLANGYMGLRGSPEMSPAAGDPGFYVAGIFDQTGRFTDEIVNLPIPIGLEANMDGFNFDLAKGRVLECRRVLDMRQGLLFTEMVYEDAIRRRFRWESVRCVHMQEKHLIIIKGSMTPLDHSGALQVTSTIDAWLTMHGSSSGANHFKAITVKDLGDTGIGLDLSMKHYDMQVSQIASLTLKGSDNRRVAMDDDRIAETFSTAMKQGKPVQFEKRIVCVTSRDDADPAAAATAIMTRLNKRSSAALLASHTKAWERIWETVDVQIDGDPAAQHGLRFNLFHLASLGNADDDYVSIGAKGLHGNGYNGQVFWDTEIYLVPFFTYTDPKTARTLLKYRFNFLQDARENAKDLGYDGVHFPWNSSSVTAREATWKGWQEHLNADIAYAVDQYVQASGDRQFYLDCGAQLIVETAMFWPSRLTYDPETDRYNMHHLTGPDEIHRNISNNATTNYLAKWHLQRAVQAVKDLRRAKRWEAVRKAAGVDDKAVAKWTDIAAKIPLMFSEKHGFHEQFEGYFKLKERAIDRSMTKMQYTGPVQHSFMPTKVAQQADIMVLYHLFAPDFSAPVKGRGFDYYEPRCSHTSTLSKSMFAAVAAQSGRLAEAHRLFMESLATDTGPTAECDSGIHAACLGGNWQVAAMGFGGFHVADGLPCLTPCLPDGWTRLAFKVRWRGKVLDVVITPETVAMQTDRGSITVRVHGVETRVTADGVAGPCG